MPDTITGHDVRRSRWGTSLFAAILAGLMALTCWVLIPYSENDLLPVSIRPPAGSTAIVLVLRSQDCPGFEWFARQLRRRLPTDQREFARIVIVSPLAEARAGGGAARDAWFASEADHIARTLFPLRRLPHSVNQGPSLVLLDGMGVIRAVTVLTPSPAVMYAQLDAISSIAQALRY